MGLSDIFSSSESGGGWEKIPLDKVQKGARQFLKGLYQAEAPVQQVEGMTGLEQWGQDFLRQFVNASGDTQQRQFVESKIKEIAGGQDITKLPEYEAIIKRITDEGNLIANRLGRGLQMTGNAPSQAGAGRDVLGRSIGETQSYLMSALAPFASEERSRQTSALQFLEDLQTNKDSRDITKLGLIQSIGGLPRMIEDFKNQAEFASQLFKFNTQAPIASDLLNMQRYAYQAPTVSPSLFSQVAPVLAAAIPFSGGGAKSGYAVSSPSVTNVGGKNDVLTPGYNFGNPFGR